MGHRSIMMERHLQAQIHHDGDAPKQALKRVTHYDNGQITDYIVKTQLLTSTSFRPLHDLAMSTEATRVGQMLYVLRQQRATIYELKTDSVLYRPLKRAKKCLENLEYKDLAVRSVFEIASQRRLDQYHKLEIPSEAEKVFRVNEAIENDLMKMQPNGPNRKGTYTHEDFQWNDVNTEEAERIVINGGSLLVLGIAGTGKSTYVKK